MVLSRHYGGQLRRASSVLAVEEVELYSGGEASLLTAFAFLPPTSSR